MKQILTHDWLFDHVVGPTLLLSMSFQAVHFLDDTFHLSVLPSPITQTAEEYHRNGCEEYPRHYGPACAPSQGN